MGARFWFVVAALASSAGPSFIVVLWAPVLFSRGTRVNLRIDLENFRELKKVRCFRFDEVRQRFRLTLTEKRVAVFVLATFVLGLATKCYRDTHPQQAVLINKEHARVKKAQP
jgi:hypothetical protein